MKLLNRHSFFFMAVTLCWVLLSSPLPADEGAAVEEMGDQGTAEGAPALTIGANYTIHSDILGEDRPYQVDLPADCVAGGAAAPCPVLYALDGPDHFRYASGMLAKMAENMQIPPMIVVAVDNTENRMRDLTPTHTMIDFEGEENPVNASSGGGEAFLNFLQMELLPAVERRYAPMPYRVLFGHSLGGLLALHALVTRPGLFQACIAVDPSLWWDQQELVERAEVTFRSRDDVRNKVFISMADHGPGGDAGAVVMETAAKRFDYALEANGSPQLYSTLKKYPREDHNSVVMPSLYDGLRFVFDGYKNPPAAVASRGLEAIKTWYQDYLAAYGISLKVPRSVLTNMSEQALKNGEKDKAVSYMEYLLAMNPGDPMSNFMLAMTYAEVDRKDLAIRYYKKAIELAPQYAGYVQPYIDALKE